MDETRPIKRRANSFDVAERAGVSQSTVSRALSGSPAITEVTRNRVIAAARELDYHVDERAARLRRGTSGVLALVVIRRPPTEDSDPTEGVNSFSYRLIAAVCDAAAARGYETLVSMQGEEERFYADYVATGQADAVIVIGTTSNTKAWSFFEARTDDRIAYWGAPFDHAARIRSDNREGGRLAGSHLVRQGYRRIALVGDPDDPQRQFADRFAGCQEALERAGLTPAAYASGEGADREAQGRAAVAHLLGSGAEFDAIFAACDEIALGVLQELAERGLHVPETVGVVGFDGAAIGAYARPPLATVKPDLAQAGERLVAAALGEAADAEARAVPVALIERSSATRTR